MAERQVLAIYRYTSGSPIDEVAVFTNEGGGRRAYIHASANASPEQLDQIKAAFSSREWKSVPITHNGQPALEVRGFKKPEQLFELLESHRWVSGTPEITQAEGDIRTKAQVAKNASLMLAGISYNVGDASYMTYTFKRAASEWHHGGGARFFGVMDIVAGVGYTLGSLALTFHGAHDQSQNIIRKSTKKLHDFFRQEGTNVSDDASLKTIQKEPDRNIFGKINDLARKYPSETLNSVYVGVGATLSAAAFYRASAALSLPKTHKLQPTWKEEAWDVGLGVVTGTSALTGLLVKERKIDPEDRRTGLGRIIDWVEEKPLRATGFGYMIATGFHAVGTYKKYYSPHEIDQAARKQIRETVVWRGMFVAANVVSEILLSISSKGHGVGVKPDDSVDKTVLAAAAETIAHNTPDKQAAMIQHTAGYLSAANLIEGKASDIAAHLAKEVQDAKANPWSASRTMGNPDNRIAQIEHHATVAGPQKQMIA